MPINSLTIHAFASPRLALPSPGHAPQSNAFAARISPSPLHAAALLRHCPVSRCPALRCRRCSQPVMAEPPNASAYRSVAGPSRVRAFPCYSFAALLQAALVLRRAWPSLAFPSRRRAKQISSFAALGLAGLLRRRSARCHAILFRRLPEQIKALPLQRPSPQRHRDARPSHANPLPPTSSRCRRISLKASPRCSVAPPHNATQIHRRPHRRCSVATQCLLRALPRVAIATLR